MNPKSIFIHTAFISFFYHGFAQQAFTPEQLVWEFPKKEIKYKLQQQPFVLSDTMIVSANAVYLKTVEREYREHYKVVKTTKSFLYMRFFVDGRVFVSFAYLSYPNVEELNDTNYGKFGRYIIKDGEIIVELYMNREYGVQYMFAKTTPSGIQFYAIGGSWNQKIKKKNMGEGFYQKKFMKFIN